MADWNGFQKWLSLPNASIGLPAEVRRFGTQACGNDNPSF
jgi:hypothetical protein